jgi:hypothetical protein
MISLGAALKNSQDTKRALEGMKTLKESDSSGPAVMLPSPLQRQEQMPPQPNDLPNIPPPSHSAEEKLVPPVIVLEDGTLPPPDPNGLPIQIYVPPELPISDIIERKGDERTRKYLELIRDVVLKGNPLWKHIGGGRLQEDGTELGEYWHFGPGYAEDEFRNRGDGHPGSRWADITFEGPNGEIIHIQLVDVYKNGEPTIRERDALRALAQPHFVKGKLIRPQVYWVAKPWQLTRQTSKSSKGGGGSGSGGDAGGGGNNAGP